MGADDGDDTRRARRLVRLLLSGVLRVDGDPRLVGAARAIRRRLPGDAEYGDPLSVAGEEPTHVLGRRLAAVGEQRPSILREMGFGALQAFQALSEAQGRGHGRKEVAILFTDLVGFSDWTLDAGDTMALDLLRRVGLAADPEITSRGGRIVKRLGDGVMAVFPEAEDAVLAALGAVGAASEVTVGGHKAQMRAGIHLGTPRRLGGDFYGVDVNIGARVTSAAGAGEVLISDAVRRRIEADDLQFRRRWRFKGKGAPKDLRVYIVREG